MDLNTFKEYLKLHLLSLEQDSEEIEKLIINYTNGDDDGYRDLEIEDISINGQIIACYHLLEVLSE
jgi:hypothetical protein